MNQSTYTLVPFCLEAKANHYQSLSYQLIGSLYNYQNRIYSLVELHEHKNINLQTFVVFSLYTNWSFPVYFSSDNKQNHIYIYHFGIHKAQMRTPLLCSCLFNVKNNVDKKKEIVGKKEDEWK